MIDLERQLRAYGEQFGAHFDPFELDELTRDVQVAAPPTGRSRRPWTVAVAAGVAVLLVVGGAALLLRATITDSVPPVTDLATTTPPTTTPDITQEPTHTVDVEPQADPESSSTTAPTLTTAAPAIAFATEGWQRHDISSDAFGSERFLHITEIVEWKGRLYAVGTVADERRWPVIWASDDGVEWTRTFAGSGEDNIMAVTPGGPGLVAVGSHHRVAPTPTWVSEDGVTWVETRHDMPDMKDITVVGDRLVAVAALGNEDISEQRQFNDPPLYSSNDGATWTGISPTNFEPAQNGQLWELHAVVSGAAGLVAYGEIAVDDTAPSETDTNYRPDAAFWTSVDGTTWTWANVPTHLTGGLVGSVPGNALAGGPHGYVAYRQLSTRIVDGDVVDGSDIVLFSQDGSQWEIGLELHEDREMSITAVAATAEGFIATGADHNRRRGVIWTSPDGMTWTLVSEDQTMFENVAIDGVWLTETGLIALGHVGVEWGPENEIVSGCAGPELPDCPPVILTWSPGAP